MLTDLNDGEPPLDPVRQLAVRDEFAAADPAVVDSARNRLAARLLTAGGHYPRELPGHLVDDLRMVMSVAGGAREAAALPADALDLGAALVVLGNVRLHLDRLEANLLNGAQQVGLGWDVIAAVLGIPAIQARGRLAILRARPDPRLSAGRAGRRACSGMAQFEAGVWKQARRSRCHGVVGEGGSPHRSSM